MRRPTNHPLEADSFAIAALSGTVVLWGVVSPLLKSASLSGPALSLHRLWIGALALLLISWFAREPVRRDGAKWSLLAGAVFGLNLLCFVLAIKLTTVANATLIGALQPAIVLLVAGRLFGEKVGGREIAAVAIAIAGVTLVIIGSSGTPEWNPAGDALALLAVLTYTGYFLISKQQRARVAPLPYVTAVHVIATFVVLPMALAHPGEIVAFEPGDIAIVLVFALVSGTGGQFVVNWAHRYVDVSVSSLMMLAVPVAASIAAWLMLGESLGPLQLIGGAITLGGIATILRRSPAPSPVESEVAPDADRPMLPEAAGGR